MAAQSVRSSVAFARPNRRYGSIRKRHASCVCPSVMTGTQTPERHPAKPPSAKGRLLHDHRALQQLLTQLTSALEDGDPVDIGDVWTQFERRLRDHIDTEERCLFPLVAVAHRADVEGLSLEHQRIRAALGELGNLVDLHALRKASVDELILYLLQHAAHEERTLYQWLEDDTAPPQGLLAMLARRAGAQPSGPDE